MSLPSEDKSYRSRREMLEEIVVLLGGRVAEAVILDDISTGASNDIERATNLVFSMITKYGMSEKLGPITYGSSDGEVFLGKEFGHNKTYSEETAAKIDAEVKEYITDGYAKTEKILREHVDQLHVIAKFLFEHEKMTGEQFACAMEGKEIPEDKDEDDEPSDTVTAEASETENSESIAAESEKEEVPDDYELAEEDEISEEAVQEDNDSDEDDSSDDDDEETVFYTGYDKNKKQ